jgi:hypothetical protein
MSGGAAMGRSCSVHDVAEAIAVTNAFFRSIDA